MLCRKVERNRWNTLRPIGYAIPFIVAGAVPWAVIFTYIGVNTSLSNIPGFVWGILAAYLIFFNTL